MIGGHNQRDGGYTILPLLPGRSEQLGATIRFNADVMTEWIAAAEHLALIHSKIVHNVNTVLITELKQAEARYDKARAEALEIMAAYLPPERSRS